MQIVDLRADDTAAIRQIAEMMVDAFREHWPEAWPDLAVALEEVVLGWIGGIHEYDGNAWELPPLGVRPDRQGQGYVVVGVIPDANGLGKPDILVAKRVGGEKG